MSVSVYTHFPLSPGCYLPLESRYLEYIIRLVYSHVLQASSDDFAGLSVTLALSVTSAIAIITSMIVFLLFSTTCQHRSYDAYLACSICSSAVTFHARNKLPSFSLSFDHTNARTQCREPPEDFGQCFSCQDTLDQTLASKISKWLFEAVHL